MPKTKAANLIVLTLIVILMCAYIYSFISKLTSLNAILAPFNAAISGGVLMFTYYKSSRNQCANLSLLLFAIGCFLWMLANIFYGVFTLLGMHTALSILKSASYLAPNCLFGAGIFCFGYHQYNKWRSLKSVFEALTIGVLCVFFMWTTFIGREQTTANFLASHGVLFAVTKFLHIFVLFELLLIFISEVRHHIPFYTWIIATGVFMFFVTNFIFNYFVFINSYYPNSIVDLLYYISLSTIAIGALMKPLLNNPPSDLSVTDDTGRSRWVYFLIFPMMSLIFQGFQIINLFVYTGIIALNHASVKYIRLASQNERLLENELSRNANLEKLIQEQLQELMLLTNEDTVTKLYNRQHFSVLLEESISSLRDGETLAIVQFDLDRFKTINDNYGHDVGDKVIVEISNRLVAWNKSDAVLARLGGDEFAILLCSSLPRYRLTRCCKEIIEICSAPIYIDHQVLYLTISVGIAVCPIDALDSISLMKNTDIAMYKAKAEGYNKYVYYNPSFKEYISRKNEIETLLRNADLQTEFELVYQPQFTLPDKKLIGAEALIRWKSAERGYIPPSVFVPIAEEINYISRIGKWVLGKAVEQVVTWNTEHGLNLKMGINISPKQLSEDDFFMSLKTLITTNQINTAWIDAEITENLMIEDISRVKPIFDLFKELQISVSIDDFGSGYSSLGYLNKYHFDRIKIDKSLIDNLTDAGGSGEEVVKAIITMANAVGKLTIAEGVETKEQLQILSALGCRQVQGYLLGKPVSAAEFTRRFIKQA